MLQKKCVWQVTTIIQPALRHLGTFHFLKVLNNKIPMGQIKWPLVLFFMYMLVLSEKMSIFPKSNMFWILVFSCPKMTLITIFTRMTQRETAQRYNLKHVCLKQMNLMKMRLEVASSLTICYCTEKVKRPCGPSVVIA